MLNCDIVVNVQGDEPLIPPENIDQVIDCLDKNPTLNVATLMMAVHESDEIIDPNVVKVVTDQKGRALYFSRSAIPFHRDAWKNGLPESISKVKEEGVSRVFRHIGLYLCYSGCLGARNRSRAGIGEGRLGCRSGVW